MRVPQPGDGADPASGWLQAASALFLEEEMTLNRAEQEDSGLGEI